MVPTLRSLLTSVVDYAGLFPPATLGMGEALREYANDREDRGAWMLGRFMLPITRTEEFATFIGPILAEHDNASPWTLGLILSKHPESDLEQVIAFREKWDANITVEALEIPPIDAADIPQIATLAPLDLQLYFEIPLDPDLERSLTAVATTGMAAKVRTGGLTSAAHPSPTSLSTFLIACAAAKVAFKATAGLHHPVRGTYPISEDSPSPTAVMHGFLNLAVAAAIVQGKQRGEETVRHVLEETSCDAFQFSDDGILWRDVWVDTLLLEETRQEFFHSFGSCSFQEPLAELEQAGLV